LIPALPVAWQIIAILVVLGPTLIAVLIVVLTHEEGKGQYLGCDWHKSGELFDKVSRARDRSSIVLTDVFAGPEVAWFTGLRVVAGPYGESSSIEDAQRAFLSTNFEPMREVVRRRGVDYVLICEPEDVSSEAASNSVNERLLTGSDVPDWLLPLEDDNSLNLRLYRIVEDKI